MTAQIRSKIAAASLALAMSATLLSAAPAAAAQTYAWGISVPGAKNKCQSATNKKIKEIRADGGVLTKLSNCKFGVGWNSGTGKPVIYHSTNLKWRQKY